MTSCIPACRVVRSLATPCSPLLLRLQFSCMACLPLWQLVFATLCRGEQVDSSGCRVRNVWVELCLFLHLGSVSVVSLHCSVRSQRSMRILLRLPVLCVLLLSFRVVLKKYMGIKQYPYTKLLLKNNRCKDNGFILINNGLLKIFFCGLTALQRNSLFSC